MATKNFAVKTKSETYGTVTFDVLQASSASAAKSAAITEVESKQLAPPASVTDSTAVSVSELLSDTQPDLFGRIAANPGS